MKVLLVEPQFPTKTKSKNHKNFLPIGLLKLASYYENKSYDVELVRGKAKPTNFEIPSIIEITSLFTYWSEQVWDCVKFYRDLFPDSKTTEIRIGGIYASLRFDGPDFNAKCQKYEVTPFKGVQKDADKFPPDYRLVMNGENNIDYQIVHSSRGCFRHCAFCGTWIIEPEFEPKNSIKNIIEHGLELGLRNLVFYDNNLLYNPHIKELLKELIELKSQRKIGWCESQSGFDGRLLEKDPELAELIKKARFRNIRIAWDNGLEDKPAIKNQIEILVKAGYNTKDISVFMIYNFDITYEDMIKKLEYCKTLGVQITDCRYRPLEIDYDNYLPHMRNGQPEGGYYIHKKAGWTDKKIRDFRKQVRQHNIWVRYAKDKGLEYDLNMEKWSAINNKFKFFKLEKPPYMEEIRENQIILKRIKKLTKLKKYYEDNKISPPDLSKINKSELDKELNNLLEKSYNVSKNPTIQEHICAEV